MVETLETMLQVLILQHLEQQIKVLLVEKELLQVLLMDLVEVVEQVVLVEIQLELRLEMVELE